MNSIFTIADVAIFNCQKFTLRLAKSYIVRLAAKHGVSSQLFDTALSAKTKAAFIDACETIQADARN